MSFHQEFGFRYFQESRVSGSLPLLCFLPFLSRLALSTVNEQLRPGGSSLIMLYSPFTPPLLHKVVPVRLACVMLLARINSEL